MGEVIRKQEGFKIGSRAFGKLAGEIKKNCYLPFSLISVFGTAFTCLLSYCYTDEKRTSYTVLQAFFSDEVPRETIPFLEVWKDGIGTWSFLLLPFLLSVGYLYVTASEQKSGSLRFSLIREGNIRYCLTKTLSHMLCGGMFMVLGYLLYGLLCLPFFPLLSAFPAEEAAYHLGLLGIRSVPVFLAVRLFGVFFYGMFMNLFSYLVSVFFSDTYILLCLPMMLSYIYSSVLGALESRWMDSGKEKALERTQLFHMENVFMAPAWKGRLCTAGIFLGAYILVFLLFVLRVREWTINAEEMRG